MIYPKFHPLTDLFWKYYIRSIIKSDFDRFLFDENFSIDPQQSVLVLANHFSWWDGFFVYDINQRLLQKRFHVMMLEEQLQKHKLLRGAGAYSINRSNGKDIVESLSYSAQILESPHNLLLMFPQGRIESMHREILSFQSGVARILKQVDAPVQILFCINLIDYQSQRKPIVQTFLKKHTDSFELTAIQNGFQSHYEHSKSQLASKFC